MSETLLQSATTRKTIDREDRDSINTFACAALPVRSKGLFRLRLIKNVRLETRVEAFRGTGTGSGQFDIDELPHYVDPGQDLTRHDVPMLKKVGQLPAFDCYSLRRAVRSSGIDVDATEVLSLSDEKKRELAGHMRNLTRPLVHHVFGDENLDITDPRNLRDIMQMADKDKARKNLAQLSAVLETDLDGLPELLEDYGDAFLSLGYYRSYLNLIIPRVKELHGWIEEAGERGSFRQGDPAMKRLKQVSGAIDLIMKSVTERFRRFDGTAAFDWEKLTLNEFRTSRDLILAHQSSLAEVLCGLTVKVYEWRSRFAKPNVGIQQRVDFVQSDLFPGLDHLLKVESGAPNF
ncbi:hypothetical protein NUH88_11575 [Nisaea acidiphila]|uniref:Uncharacterized protein n=1 Tax=Nisaea acidiphila TaxID=1862145 RepID=A0A9J7AK64_9PROT|nr:hypothetical protein [Nisaea acidiphila]UUX48059.1 hypothetical protein NUH88_11575 [Nisaea acidiphila]